MNVKELKRQRNKPQSITNILDKKFEFKWDGLDYEIAKGETQSHPFFLAEHAAFHMSRAHCLNKSINFHKEWGKVVDEIMGKKFIDYNKLTKAQALNLSKDRKLQIEDENWELKTKTELIDQLKASH